MENETLTQNRTRDIKKKQRVVIENEKIAVKCNRRVESSDRKREMCLVNRVHKVWSGTETKRTSQEKSPTPRDHEKWDVFYWWSRLKREEKFGKLTSRRLVKWKLQEATRRWKSLIVFHRNYQSNDQCIFNPSHDWENETFLKKIIFTNWNWNKFP